MRTSEIRKIFRTTMVAAAIAIVMPSMSAAQNTTPATGGADNGGAYGSTGSSNTNTSDNNNDNDRNWSWIGLLGLAGLFGLRRRDTHARRDVHRDDFETTRQP